MSATRVSAAFAAGFVALATSLVPAERLGAQLVAPRLATWRAEIVPPIECRGRSVLAHPMPAIQVREGSVRRHHAATGLLIGSAVGALATTVFLIGFCGDADSACGADEVGRAIVVFAVPCAVAGAFVGWLIRTDGT